MSHPTIAFDLDGTLVDSLPDIVASFRHAFTEHALVPPDEAAVRALVGLPLEAMFAHFVDDVRVPGLAGSYRRHYPLHFTDRSRPFPGVVELLDELGRRGYLRVVATTKRSAVARSFVAALGLAPLLDHVQGTDGFPHKPAPDVILRALEAVNGAGVWMVGDTVSDVQAGRAAGLSTYAVTWGTHDAERLRSAGPEVLADDLGGLLARLDPR